jgi:Ser/Thr protein kinase RdoA (MazF antagonist)
MTADPALLTGLLPRWGLDAAAALVPAARGSNNETFLFGQGGRRFVLRVSSRLPAAQIAVEHRILRRLGQAGLPFAVPRPLAAGDGRTAVESEAGIVTLCPLIPGDHPDLTRGPVLERYGRAVAQLGQALQRMPLADAPRDWRGHPRPGAPSRGEIARLRHELRAAGVPDAQTAPLDTVARGWERDWLPDAGRLPVQVIHGDLASGNTLVDPESGAVTGLLDFQLCGTGFAVQDPLAALYNSPLLASRDWPPRVTAFLRGYASVRPLSRAEAGALPALLLARSFGSALWRAGQWQAGHVELGEVTGRITRLGEVAGWVAAHGPHLESLAVAASGH